MPKFNSPMLASDFDPAKLKFPLLASVKIDGIRCVITRGEDGLVDAFTRSGKPIRNRFIKERIGLTPYAGLDGELVVGDAFAPDVYNRTSSGVMSMDGEPDFTFWVFDLYGPDRDGRTDLFYDQRQAAASWAITNGPGGAQDGAWALGATEDLHVRMLPQHWVHNMEELEAFEARALEQGFEGIMLRQLAKCYKYGRSTVGGGELLKVKRTARDEAEIIGFEEQFFNGNDAFIDERGHTKRSSAKDGKVPADTLGAFICRNRAKWEPDFNVGPGVLTHAERKAVWDNREAYIGRAITFKHLPHGAKDRPRHGRFYGFRDPSDMS